MSDFGGGSLRRTLSRHSQIADSSRPLSFRKLAYAEWPRARRIGVTKMAKRNIPAALTLVAVSAAAIYVLQNPSTSWAQPQTIDDSPSNFCIDYQDACEPEKQSNVDAALVALKQESVIHNVVADGSFIYVSVWDDGTDRTGYAMYVCEVLREYGVIGRVVKVVEIAQLIGRDKIVVLGRYRCKESID